MNKNIFITVLLIIININVFGQEDDRLIREVVLANNVKDSLYVFGKWDKAGGTETHLQYLGMLETEGGNFKIMTSIWFWGLSQRATSRVLVFNDKNEYLGNYYVGMINDLPDKIANNQIVFRHSKSNDCDKTKITWLSFEKGIPEEFFLECKDGYGDIYIFDKE